MQLDCSKASTAFTSTRMLPVPRACGDPRAHWNRSGPGDPRPNPPLGGVFIPESRQDNKTSTSDRPRSWLSRINFEHRHSEGRYYHL